MKTKHPNTDAHRAGCSSCQMEYDKRLPDSSYPDGVEMSCEQYKRFDALKKAVGALLDMSFDQVVRDARADGWFYEAAQLRRVERAYLQLKKAETRG